MELIGTYPLLLSGEEVGSLNIEKQGLFWHFYAKCPIQNQIIRLSIFSKDEESYLGIMAPKGDILVFEKKYSRSGIEMFPKEILYCGEKGKSQVIDIPEKMLVVEEIAPLEEEIVIETDNLAPLDVEIKDISKEELPPVIEPHEERDLFSPQSPNSCEENEAIAVNALADKLDFGKPSPLSGNFNQLTKSFSPLDEEIAEVFQENIPQEEAVAEENEESELELKNRPPPVFLLENLNFLPCPCPSSLFGNSYLKSVMGNVTSAFMCKTDEFTLFAIPENSNSHLLFVQNNLQLFDYKILENSYKIAVIKDGNFATEILA